MRTSSLRASLVHDERGFTLTELLVVMAILGFIMAGLANVFVSGAHTSLVLNGQLDAQQSVRLALDRLEYDGRCSTSATVLGSGAGVAFSLPSQCSHASGNVSWCVVSGALRRYTATSCTGSAQTYVRYLTSAAPFSLLTATGSHPRLQVALTANPTGLGPDSFRVSDAITLRNSTAS